MRELELPKVDSPKRAPEEKVTRELVAPKKMIPNRSLPQRNAVLKELTPPPQESHARELELLQEDLPNLPQISQDVMVVMVSSVLIAFQLLDSHRNCKNQSTLEASSNYQPVINGSPPTVNQSAIEIKPLDALKEELQKDQEETDTRVNGLTSPNKPPFKLECCQEMELPTPCQTHMQSEIHLNF